MAARWPAGTAHVRPTPNPIWFQGTLRDQHGLLLFYGPRTPESWLTAALERWGELLSKQEPTGRGAPPSGLYVAGEVAPAERLANCKMQPPGLQVLTTPEELDTFLLRVRAYQAERPSAPLPP